MIEVYGYTPIGGIRNFENGGILWALRSFKPLEGLIGPYLVQCVSYMETPKAAVAGMARLVRDCQREMRWTWVVMHPGGPEHLVCPKVCFAQRLIRGVTPSGSSKCCEIFSSY